jgi:DNA-binding response OmpR family regulator
MKFLLVEDEEKVAHFISKGLEEEGYAIDVAYDGRRGLELLKEFTYDLLLLDLMTPVLIITAKSSKEDVVKGLDTGSDDYLTKPFSFDELLARIRALLRRSKMVDSHIIDYKGIVLNPYTRKLHIGTKEVELTEKEFLIMECMLKNTEKPLTRKEIADYVWQNQTDSTNIVDVYVNFLRKKIESVTNKKYIHTVRGTGYVLREDDEKV